nr:MAG TPA: hypothetical protein [Caudoviricetes sp.]
MFTTLALMFIHRCLYFALNTAVNCSFHKISVARGK